MIAASGIIEYPTFSANPVASVASDEGNLFCFALSYNLFVQS